MATIKVNSNYGEVSIKDCLIDTGICLEEGVDIFDENDLFLCELTNYSTGELNDNKNLVNYLIDTYGNI